MQKVAMIALTVFLVMGILVNSNMISAKETISITGKASLEDGSQSNATVNASSDDDSNSTVNTTDDRDDSKKETPSERIKREQKERAENRNKLIEARRAEKEFKHDIKDSNGRRVIIEKNLSLNTDGSLKIQITRRVILANGTVEIRVITIDKSESGEARVIKTEGNETINVEDNLKVDDEFKGNETELGVIDSEGSRHIILILPDKAAEIARKRLAAHNFTVELREVLDKEHKNVPRVVYNIKSDKPGRFLGIFKLALKTETQIDPETGETIVVSKPWWAFLVSEPNDNTNTGSNETDTNTTTDVTANTTTNTSVEAPVDCFDSEKGKFVNCDELNATNASSD